jgi:hypothetical protein
MLYTLLVIQKFLMQQEYEKEKQGDDDFNAALFLNLLFLAPSQLFLVQWVIVPTAIHISG